MLLPSAVFTCWHLAGWSRFGVSALSTTSKSNLRRPLAGLAGVSDRFGPTTSAENLFRVLSLAVRLLVALAAAGAWRSTRADLGTRLSWLAAVGLLLVISENVYGGATSFMRAGTESYLLGITVLLGTSHRRLVALTPPIGSLAALTIVGEMVKAT